MLLGVPKIEIAPFVVAASKRDVSGILMLRLTGTAGSIGRRTTEMVSNEPRLSMIIVLKRERSAFAIVSPVSSSFSTPRAVNEFFKVGSVLGT